MLAVVGKGDDKDAELLYSDGPDPFAEPAGVPVGRLTQAQWTWADTDAGSVFPQLTALAPNPPLRSTARPRARREQPLPLAGGPTDNRGRVRAWGLGPLPARRLAATAVRGLSRRGFRGRTRPTRAA